MDFLAFLNSFLCVCFRYCSLFFPPSSLWHNKAPGVRTPARWQHQPPPSFAAVRPELSTQVETPQRGNTLWGGDHMGSESFNIRHVCRKRGNYKTTIQGGGFHKSGVWTWGLLYKQLTRKIRYGCSRLLTSLGTSSRKELHGGGDPNEARCHYYTNILSALGSWVTESTHAVYKVRYWLSLHSPSAPLTALLPTPNPALNICK